MEPERPSPEPSAEPPRARPAPEAGGELRGLLRLRDRIEATAREMERLRTENAALAARVAALETDGRGELDALEGRALDLSGESPERLRAQIQGFIAAIDEVLRQPRATPEGEAPEGPIDDDTP